MFIPSACIHALGADGVAGEDPQHGGNRTGKDMMELLRLEVVQAGGVRGTGSSPPGCPFVLLSRNAHRAGHRTVVNRPHVGYCVSGVRRPQFKFDFLSDGFSF